MLYNLFFWSGPTAIDVLSKALVMMLIVASWDMELVGTVNLAILCFSYFTLMHLGLLDGLKLKLSSLNVTNQEKDFDYHSNSVCSIHLIFSCCLLVTLGAAFFVFRPALSGSVWLGVLSVALSNIFYAFYINQIVYYRYKFEIRDVSMIRMAPACVRVFIQLPCAMFFGIVGFLLCEPLVFLAPSILLFRKRKKPIFSIPNKGVLKDLWGLGLPVFFIGITDLFMVTQDRVLIASTSELDVFGNYAVAAYICSVFLFMPSQLLSFVGQQLREWFSLGLEPSKGFRIKQNLGFFIILLWTLGGGVVITATYFVLQHKSILVQNVMGVLPFLWGVVILRLSISITNSIFIIIERGFLVFAFNLVGVCFTFFVLFLGTFAEDYGNVMAVIMATVIGLFVQILVSLVSFSLIYRGSLITALKAFLFTASCFHVFTFGSLFILSRVFDVMRTRSAPWFDFISLEMFSYTTVLSIIIIFFTTGSACSAKKIGELLHLMDRKYVNN